MPELPEVETIVQDFLQANFVGRTIQRAQVFWHHSLASPSVKEFERQIAGQKVKNIQRRGKYLIFTLSDATLLVHLRMTGKFAFGKNEPPTSHERIRLWLDDGTVLRYEDQRKFGKWILTQDPEQILSRIGLEPLSADFTLDAFTKLLHAHPQLSLKSFLLNQNFVAGLGNIYVDEALWDAQLHPLRRIQTLKKENIRALHQAIPKVLERGIANMGTSLGSKQANYFSVSGRKGNHQHQLQVFRRDGLACPRCGEAIVKITVSQRGTHLCPHCQKL